MPEWGRFGYGVELDEKTVREIGMKLCKNENALYETSELEWRHHPFSLAPVSSLNGNLVMLIGAFESATDCQVHEFNLSELLQKHTDSKDLEVMNSFLQIYAPHKRVMVWLY